MTLKLENIDRVLDYRTGETIDEWLTRTGLTPNHMRAVMNELRLFGDVTLSYEPDASGHIPTHDELARAWQQPATAPPKAKTWEENLEELRRLPPVSPAKEARYQRLFSLMGFPDDEIWAEYAERNGITPEVMEMGWRMVNAQDGIIVTGPVTETEIYYWSSWLKNDPRSDEPTKDGSPASGKEAEVPWWLKKGRAAAAQRAAAEAAPTKKPFWAKTIKPAEGIAQRAAADAAPTEKPFWAKTIKPAEGMAQRNGRSSAPNEQQADAKKGRALTPDEIDRALGEIYRRVDPISRETWGSYCERNGITREDVIRDFGLAKPDCTYEFEDTGRERLPPWLQPKITKRDLDAYERRQDEDMYRLLGFYGDEPRPPLPRSLPPHLWKYDREP